MKVLVDTHALLWWASASPRLGRSARALIADRRHDLFYSVATPWELAIKISINKLEADLDTLFATAGEAGFRQLDGAPAHYKAIIALGRLHGDPFDRMIVAQAIVEGATLLTDDTAIRRYPVRTVGCD